MNWWAWGPEKRNGNRSRPECEPIKTRIQRNELLKYSLILWQVWNCQYLKWGVADRCLLLRIATFHS